MLVSYRYSPSATDAPEREVADVFHVSLLFHVGCVGYTCETFAQFGDDLAVRRAAVEADLTDMRDIFATSIPRSTRGLPPAALQRRIRLGAVLLLYRDVFAQRRM